MFLTRHLALADYGRYALALVLVNWIANSISIATGSALVRMVAGNPQGERYAAAVLQLAGMAGTALGILVFLCAEPIALTMNSPGISGLLKILAVEIPVSALCTVYCGILTAKGKNAKSAASLIAGSALQLGAILVFTASGLGVDGAAWAMVVAEFGQLAILKAMDSTPLVGGDRAPFSEIWAHARLIGGAQVLLRFSQTMDLVAAKYFLGSPALAGLYAGAQNISFAAMMLFAPSTSVVLQALSKSRMEGNHSEAGSIATTYIRVGLIFGGALVAMSPMSPQIALLLLGPQFKGAGPVLAVLLTAVAFRINAVIGRTLIAATGEQALIMFPLVVLIGFGIAAFALVVPSAGLLGAACVAAFLALGTAIFSLRDGMKLLGIRYPWATFLRVAVASAATGGAGFWLKDCGFHVLVNLTMATVFYGAMIILLREWRPKRWHLREIQDRLRCLQPNKKTL